MVADVVVFNSSFNLQSFLGAIPKVLSTIPRPSRPSGILDRIEKKCRVLYFPLLVEPKVGASVDDKNHRETKSPLHIVWPHRWEFDKDPDTFCRVLLELHSAGLDFVVSVLGKR